MNSADLSCWKCGASLAGILLPLIRLSKCKSCNADLHVCRMCVFFDTTVNNSCREPVAEKVIDKQRKNFCGYLQPSADAFIASVNPGQAAAKSQLNSLFNLNSGTHKKDEPGGPLSAAEESKRELEAFFKPDKKT